MKRAAIGVVVASVVIGVAIFATHYAPHDHPQEAETQTSACSGSFPPTDNYVSYIYGTVAAVEVDVFDRDRFFYDYSAITVDVAASQVLDSVSSIGYDERVMWPSLDVDEFQPGSCVFVAGHFGRYACGGEVTCFGFVATDIRVVSPA